MTAKASPHVRTASAVLPWHPVRMFCVPPTRLSRPSHRLCGHTATADNQDGKAVRQGGGAFEKPGAAFVNESMQGASTPVPVIRTPKQRSPFPRAVLMPGKAILNCGLVLKPLRACCCRLHQVGDAAPAPTSPEHGGHMEDLVLGQRVCKRAEAAAH